jgi:hypothetical protein
MVRGSLIYPLLNHLLRLLTQKHFIQIETLKSTVSHSKCNRVKVNSEIIYPEKKDMSSVLGLYNLGGYKKLLVQRAEIGVALKRM